MEALITKARIQVENQGFIDLSLYAALLEAGLDPEAITDSFETEEISHG